MLNKADKFIRIAAVSFVAAKALPMLARRMKAFIKGEEGALASTSTRGISSPPDDVVTEASMESFPASDPPPFAPGTL